jgi:oxygen-independent coproporphyrinogen-3 oxidase
MVIQIKLNGDDYENDVYPLVKAFYPEEEVKVLRQNTDNAIIKESVTITVDTVDSSLCVLAETEERQLYKEEV